MNIVFELQVSVNDSFLVLVINSVTFPTHLFWNLCEVWHDQ